MAGDMEKAHPGKAMDPETEREIEKEKLFKGDIVGNALEKDHEGINDSPYFSPSEKIRERWKKKNSETQEDLQSDEKANSDAEAKDAKDKSPDDKDDKKKSKAIKVPKKELPSDELDNYVKSHLKNYFEFNLKQGFELDAIISCLKTYGYTIKQLRPVIRDLSTKKPHVKPVVYEYRDLDADTKHYLIGILKDYIKKMHVHGYPLLEIKKALINYGHHERLVAESLDAAYPKKKRALPRSAVFAASLLFYIFIVIALGLKLDVSMNLVLVTFSPGLIALFIVYLGSFSKKFRKSMPILSIIIIILFFIFIIPEMSTIVPLDEIDLNVVLLANVLLTILLSVLISMSPESVRIGENTK